MNMNEENRPICKLHDILLPYLEEQANLIHISKEYRMSINIPEGFTAVTETY
jgi:hypothetical protein